MELLQDWKFYAFLIQGFITMVCFAIIKFNDFKHLSKEVNKLSIKIDSIDKKLDKHEVDIDVLKEKSKDI